MAGDWRALARTVPVILEPIGAIEEGSIEPRLPKLIHDASHALHLPIHEPTPTSDLLGRANAILGRDHALHCVGARFLSLYGERLGFLQSAPVTQLNLVFQPGQGKMANANAWWESWLQSRLDAFNSMHEVSRRIRVAAAYDGAIKDAASVARVLPVGSPDREAWIRAAESFVVDAEAQASAAVDHAYTMYVAVDMESYYTRLIVGLT